MKNFAIYETKFGYFKMGYTNNNITFFKKIFDEVVTDFATKTELQIERIKNFYLIWRKKTNEQIYCTF